jgi:pectin methylesterase-like acyl-CoA thioesterase
MFRLAVLSLALTTMMSTALPATGHATSAAATLVLGPRAHQRDVCVDTPLRLRFDRPPRLGAAGTIQIHRPDGTVTDRIDLADPASNHRTIGDAVSDTGVPHEFNYVPVIITGDTAAIYPHHRLDYDQTYYVTVDAGVFTGFPGIQKATTWRFTTKADPPRTGAPRLSVAADGDGDFCTVQGAIDFVPKGNEKRVVIDVHPGTYTELDYVRPDRPHITVRGAGRDRTVLQYANNDRFNGDAALLDAPPDSSVCPRRVLATPDVHNCWRAMFGVDAPDFTLENITLHNTTPFGGSQAEAFRGNNAHITLNRVHLISFQDTLRLQGTGFVTASHIEGDVDFIWGTGAVYVRDSELTAQHAGFYTQIRNDGSRHGDVFVNDRLTRTPGLADETVYLGRIETNRFPFSEVAFIDSAMDAHVRRVGWQITPDDCSQAPNLRFEEYASTDLSGNPIDVSGRLACSHRLTDAEAAQLRDPGFVLDGWVPYTINATDTAAAVWSAPPGHSAEDRVALCRVGAPTANCSAVLQVGTGATTGTLAFAPPVLPGRYEFRYIPTGASTSTATSNAVTVPSPRRL